MVIGYLLLLIGLNFEVIVANNGRQLTNNQ